MVLRYRGNVRLHSPTIRLLRIQMSPWIWAVSWPFGVFECDETSIIVEAWPTRLSISLKDIESVVFKRAGVWGILLGDRLEISHRAGPPNHLVFNWYGLSSLVQALEELGVSVIRK